MWESQVLLTDGQVFFPRVLQFSPTFDVSKVGENWRTREKPPRLKWNILKRAVKPKSKVKKKKKKDKKHYCKSVAAVDTTITKPSFPEAQKQKKEWWTNNNIGSHYIKVQYFFYPPLGHWAHSSTVELQWLEHLWDHGNLFETRVVRATEGKSWRHVRKPMVII